MLILGSVVKHRPSNKMAEEDQLILGALGQIRRLRFGRRRRAWQHDYPCATSNPPPVIISLQLESPSDCEVWYRNVWIKKL